MRKAILVIIVLIMGMLMPSIVQSTELDYWNGYFKQLFSYIGYTTKLKDGRVLIFGRSHLNIFDPATNESTYLRDFDEALNHSSFVPKGIALNDGRALFLSPKNDYPALEFYSELVVDIVTPEVMEKELISRGKIKPSLNPKGYSPQELRMLYQQLPEAEQEDIIKPYVEKNPEFQKKYNEYSRVYEKSLYGQIYDPKTNTFKYVDKLAGHCSISYMRSLKNGKILITRARYRYSNCPDELFNPETEEFELIAKRPTFGRIIESVLLNDGNLLIYGGYGGLYLYNPETGYEKRLKTPGHGWGRVKLSDDRIVFIDGNERDWFDDRDIWIYDPKLDKEALIGRVQIPRGHWNDFNMIALPDDTVLIHGGTNYNKADWSGYTPPVRRAELFNPATGETKVLTGKKYAGYYEDSVLLDDGRVLTRGISSYLYIPKGYKKQK